MLPSEASGLCRHAGPCAVMAIILTILSVCAPVADAGEPIFIVSRGWHVELALPATELAGPLAVFRQVFPTATALSFGYGKRTFLTAPPNTPSEFLLGPFPGPALVQVTGLSKMPDVAYAPGEVTRLTLSVAGLRATENYIWSDIDRSASGTPHLIGPGRYPGSLFYSARSEYSLLHTCNTWAADAIHAGGADMTGAEVVFSGQVVSRAAAAGSCTPATEADRL
jgi:hypothetical protein